MLDAQDAVGSKSAQVLMHGSGCLSARTHGQDNGCCTCNNVSSRPDLVHGRLTGLFIGQDSTVLPRLQTGRGGGKERVGTVSDRADDSVY